MTAVKTAIKMEIMRAASWKKDYLREKQDKLITELTEFFNSNQKIVNKSVMSLVLSKLPVFFNNITEVQDYIYNSLNNCTNKAEKAACIEIINGLMENWG